MISTTPVIVREKFRFYKSSLDGLLLIEPTVFEDERGFFLESYNKTDFSAAGITENFIQDNHSYSKKGILRGLHYNLGAGSAKFVKCIEGNIFDVAVDVRIGSATFGQWESVMLSGDNKNALYLPPGFAHGFCVIGESAHVVYKTDKYFDPALDGGIRWNDPEIGIQWPLDNPIVSKRDDSLPFLKNIKK